MYSQNETFRRKYTVNKNYPGLAIFCLFCLLTLVLYYSYLSLALATECYAYIFPKQISF